MQTIALFFATCLIGLATAQQFNWYTDTNCQDYMTSTGGPSKNDACQDTPYGANSVLLASCGDAACTGWTFYVSNHGCIGENAVDGYAAPCSDCANTCDSGRCIDIGDQDAFNWSSAPNSCEPEPCKRGLDGRC